MISNPLSLIESNDPSILPNRIPKGAVPTTLAIITDVPDEEDVSANCHFSSPTGRLLYVIGQPVALSAYTSAFLSLSQDPANPQSTSYHEALKTDLATFKPNTCLLIGEGPLSSAFPGARLDTHRGSFFVSTNPHSPLFGQKCVATYHPRSIVKNYSLFQIARFDILRAVRGAKVSGLNPNPRESTIARSVDEITYELDQLLRDGRPISLDIEGGVNGLTCIGFSVDRNRAFVIPFIDGTGHPCWSLDEELRTWLLLRSFLASTRGKVLQNYLYDAFVLLYSLRCPILHLQDDTMLKHWELLCELPKSLAFQTSIYTDQPYYKGDRKSGDFLTFLRYNGTDAMVTGEINTVLEKDINKSLGAKTHYKFNTYLLRPLLYMQCRGIRYDVNEVHNTKTACQNELSRAQAELDAVAGRPINIRSPKFKDFLYTELGLPKQYKKTPLGLRLTTDYEALLRLRKTTHHPAIIATIKVARLRTFSQMLEITTDPDGRIRCGYNGVGTESGRITCYTSSTGSGTNLQTVPSEDATQPKESVLRWGLRKHFAADDGYDMGQMDLSGADGWTVAARCATLGDSTMLEDYLYGLKPAKILVLMLLYGPEVATYDRPRLKEMSKSVTKEDWRYFVCKIAQHGFNYLMQPLALTKHIFIQSDGEIELSVGETSKLQQYYFLRYRGVRLWHNWMTQMLKSKTTTSASGHTRVYFGRSTDILGQALANEPQENTTFATNMALLRLWLDPDNRRSNNSLIIEPLHQVHDALLVQWPKEYRDFALRKIPVYFTNELRIGQINVRIPFEGFYGPNWGNLKEPIPCNIYATVVS